MQPCSFSRPLISQVVSLKRIRSRTLTLSSFSGLGFRVYRALLVDFWSLGFRALLVGLQGLGFRALLVGF